MSDKPTVWLDRHQVNLTDAGEQTEADVIGLTNGNYLVVWTEEGDAVGTTPGKDIVGQLFGPEGTHIGDEFQLNQGYLSPDEQNASIAATPDGGFVLTYESFTAPNLFTIVRQKFDADFNSGTAFHNAISDSDDLYQNPVVAVRFSADAFQGEHLIVYEHFNTTDNTSDIVANVVSADGNISGGEVTLFNSDGLALGPDAAVLTSGSYVVVFENDPDGGVAGNTNARFVIKGRTSGAIENGDLIESGTNPAHNVHVAALTNGGFVAVWTETFSAVGEEVRFRIYDNAGDPQTGALPANANSLSTGDQYGADVVALADGSFVVVWNDLVTGQINGQRFKADGTALGDEFVAGNFGAEGNSVQALLADGRFITAFEESASDADIHATIFDPRTSPITGTAQSDVTTSRQDGGTVNGVGGSDVLLGQRGNDELHGGPGIDDLFGRDGNDFLFGESSNDKLYGGDGRDKLDGDSGNDLLRGEGDRDALTGDRGYDRLYGGADRDTFDFNSIRDSVRGGQRDKILDFSHGQHDKIDLRGIDAKTGGGNQKFKWIGKQDFHDKKGELHFVDRGSKVIVQGDVNGDGKPDFEIYVAAGSLSKGDFLL